MLSYQTTYYNKSGAHSNNLHQQSLWAGYSPYNNKCIAPRNSVWEVIIETAAGIFCAYIWDEKCTKDGESRNYKFVACITWFLIYEKSTL